jgi:hypothetical protein
MSAKTIGIIVGSFAACIIVIAIFTNIFDLARPTVDKYINTTENEASKVQGKDVVAGAKNVTSDIKYVTSQIKIKNPYP